jgi:Spy/CpxP family protein refolding chaperone
MKRINTFSLVITLVTLSVFCLSSLGWTQSENINPPQQLIAQAPQRGERSEPLLGRDQGGYEEIRINWRELGLSKEQQEQIQQKRREFGINTAGIREELKFALQDLRAEMVKDPVDRAKIDSILSNISALKQQMSEAAVQNLLAIKSLLTQEQLEKLAELQAQLPMEFKRLKLSAEQRTQIREVMKNSIQQNREIAEGLRELKAQLRETLLEQEVDAEKLSQLQADIAEKELAQGKARVDMLLQMKEILTPKQQKLLQKIRTIREKKNVPTAKTKKP